MYQQISVVDDRVRTFTVDDGGRSLAEATVGRTQEPWDFPLYDFYPFEYTVALSVTSVADGGLELLLRSPFLNQTMPAGPSGGPDPAESPPAGGRRDPDRGQPRLPAPRDGDRSRDGVRGRIPRHRPGGARVPRRVTTEIVYRIEHIAPLTEGDVALSPPPGIEVTERSVDLPLDHPRADVS